MIGFLSGKVKSLRNTEIILHTISDVGYRVKVLERDSIYIDQKIDLNVYTLVKENEISLWGFVNLVDMFIFEELISVSGVGAKTAMALIDSKGMEQIISCILNGEYKELKGNGVGDKTAQKIVIELKTKMSKFQQSLPVGINPNLKLNRNVSPYFDDAVEGLISLGYREEDIKKAYNMLSTDLLESLVSSSELIKHLLKII